MGDIHYFDVEQTLWGGTLFLIQKALLSNFDPQIEYSNWEFLWFYPFFEDTFQGSAWSYALTASFHIISNSLFTNHPTIQH